MAYAVLVSLIKILEERTFGNQFRISFQDENQIQNLHVKFKFLKSFLKENPQSVSSPEEFGWLERRIRTASYEVLHKIESEISDQLPAELIRELDIPESYIIELTVHNSGEEYEILMSGIDDIIEEATRIKKTINVQNTCCYPADHAGVGPSRQQTKSMVGLKEDVMDIKDRLCSESSDLHVIPIVGMGGIGKTTLARNVFEDSLITYRFDIRGWVNVSQDFTMRRIFLDLLDSMNILTKELAEEKEDKLLERIYKHLSGRRYLIVLDDVWNIEAWDNLRMIFNNGENNGSRIMLTTTLLDVAVYVDSSSHPHEMKFLNEDESWNLFKEKVFVGKEECFPSEFEQIGKGIVGKCGGLPLAIVVVAGLLGKAERTKDQWMEVFENMSSRGVAKDENLSMILSLSYNHLPYHLRACFLYLGSFPEDYEIHVSKIIKLWIAEGFLEPNEDDKSLEEVGEGYLEDLIKRSLVLVTKKKPNGKFKACNIHDVLRDFCIQKARDEDFYFVVGNMNDLNLIPKEHIWRLCIPFHSDDDSTTPQTTHPIVHSVFHSEPSPYQHVPESYPFSSMFRLLRVLDAFLLVFPSFPIEALDLIHLRYLSFRVRNLTCNLPPTISGLENLQILIVGSTRGIPKPNYYPPFEFWKMPHLRHMNCISIVLSSIPLEHGKKIPILENLQSLFTIRNFGFTNKFIELVPNLEKLGLIYTDLSQTHWSEWNLHKLVQFDKLKELNFCFQWSGLFFGMPDQFHFTLGLPSSLRKLTISDCRLPWKEMGIVGSLPYLEVLKIRDEAFGGDEWETEQGGFPELKVLDMEGLDLKQWRADGGECFPNLESLIIRKCPGLKDIPSDIGYIPTLQLIEVGNESKSLVDSALKILEEQRDMGNDLLQVRLNSQAKEKLRKFRGYPRDRIFCNLVVANQQSTEGSTD